MQITDITPELKKREEKIRLAAYCRVSSDSEDQIHSFAAQIKHYSDYAKKNPQYTLIDIYADEGLSGTGMTKRDELNRLLKDCSQGKIDRIITKSVSRLARNTEDLLTMLRMIKSFGVNVYFEEQDIDTTQMNMEMIVTFPGMVAQQESENISGNLRWSIQKRMETGKYKISRYAYGYCLRNGVIDIDEDKAKIIRKIFALYLRGMGMQQIADFLNEQKIPRLYNSKEKLWQRRTIAYILQNEKYIGDALFQKKYTTDIFPYKKKINNGQKAKYYVENYNPSIIEREQYRKVQELIAVKTKETAKNKAAYLLAGKVRCKDCGKLLRVSTSKGKTTLACSTNDRAGSCAAHRVREEAVYETFTRMIYKLKFSARTLIDELIKSLEYLYEHTGECRENIKVIDKQIADLCAKNLVVTKIYTKGILNAADFTRQTTEIGNRIKSLRSERKKFFEQNTDEANLEELKDLQETLRTYTPSSRFNEKLFEDIVHKIIVEDNATLQFHLIGGVILTEKIKVKSRCKKNEK